MKIFPILALSILLFYFKASSQLIVDLSDRKEVTETIDINNVQPVLLIKNLLPNQEKNKYSFEVNMTEEKIPSFPVNSLAASACPDDPDTKDFGKAYEDILRATDESNLPQLQKKLEDAIKKLNSTYKACIDIGVKVIKDLNYQKDLSFTLRNNQTISVKVIRVVKNKDKDSTITWTKIFKTPQKSPWLIHFGFTYQPNIISKYDQFFAKEDTSTASRYTVTKKHGNQSKFWENISPTVMFSYPFTNKKGESHLAFSAIAATNFSSFSAGTGFSYIVGENVALGTGIMFTQKYVLNGIYKEGDVIKTNLTFEQLHEKKWGPEIYFTIGLRFDKNPFAGSTEKSSAEKKDDNNSDK
jgi:hypothetical protein